MLTVKLPTAKVVPSSKLKLTRRRIFRVLEFTSGSGLLKTFQKWAAIFPPLIVITGDKDPDKRLTKIQEG